MKSEYFEETAFLYNEEREKKHSLLKDGFYYVIAVEHPKHPFKTIAQKQCNGWKFSEGSGDEMFLGPEVIDVLGFIMTEREYLDQPI